MITIWKSLIDLYGLDRLIEGLDIKNDNSPLTSIPYEELIKCIEVSNILRLKHIEKATSVLVDNYILAIQIKEAKDGNTYNGLGILKSYLLSDCFKSCTDSVIWLLDGDDLRSIETEDTGTVYTRYRVLKCDIPLRKALDGIMLGGDQAVEKYTNPLGGITKEILVNNDLMKEE